MPLAEPDVIEHVTAQAAREGRHVEREGTHVERSQAIARNKCRTSGANAAVSMATVRNILANMPGKSDRYTHDDPTQGPKDISCLRRHLGLTFQRAMEEERRRCRCWGAVRIGVGLGILCCRLRLGCRRRRRRRGRHPRRFGRRHRRSVSVGRRRGVGAIGTCTGAQVNVGGAFVSGQRSGNSTEQSRTEPKNALHTVVALAATWPDLAAAAGRCHRSAHVQAPLESVDE